MAWHAQGSHIDTCNILLLLPPHQAPVSYTPLHTGLCFRNRLTSFTTSPIEPIEPIEIIRHSHTCLILLVHDKSQWTDTSVLFDSPVVSVWSNPASLACGKDDGREGAGTKIWHYPEVANHFAITLRNRCRMDKGNSCAWMAGKCWKG